MPQPSQPTICPKREPLSDGRCKHQLPTGCCALPDELTCVEWGNARPTQKSLPGLPSPVSKPVASAPKPRPVVAPVATANEPAPVVDVNRLRGFTTEDIESFKALAVEVCLQSESFGELWLVPAYTGQPRRELTPEHLAIVLHALSVFPGSRVTGFHPPTKSGPAARQEITR
ncbi:MAG: hypothetical protein HY898_25065 [Deltaproteobacteria bacterium]|nr:hypothetical protein [Deltaproteobacteria bacterium]